MKQANIIEQESKLLAEVFGHNFITFLYRPNLDQFIKTEVLDLINPDSSKNKFLDFTHWQTKHPFNFPGPFYTGESDTCGTGDIEAPLNVLYDENTQEFIFQQPKNYVEFLGILNAAAVEIFDSYCCDGNEYWTFSKCKDWWRNRFDMLKEMSKLEAVDVNGTRSKLYEKYLTGQAEFDLKNYCYFLENGHYPQNQAVLLPNI